MENYIREEASFSAELWLERTTTIKRATNARQFLYSRFNSGVTIESGLHCLYQLSEYIVILTDK